MRLGGSRAAYIARCKLGGYKGEPKRAAFRRALGFPNMGRARAVWARMRQQRQLEEWKREELQCTCLDEPPAELFPVKRRVLAAQGRSDQLSLFLRASGGTEVVEVLSAAGNCLGTISPVARVSI